jgi:hypothetical protein
LAWLAWQKRLIEHLPKPEQITVVDADLLLEFVEGAIEEPRPPETDGQLFYRERQADVEIYEATRRCDGASPMGGSEYSH